MPTLQTTSTGDDIEGLVVMLLRDGNKSDAVALIQEETGASRTEAQQQVLELAQRHGISTLNWPVALALSLAVAAAALIAFASM